MITLGEEESCFFNYRLHVRCVCPIEDMIAKLWGFYMDQGMDNGCWVHWHSEILFPIIVFSPLSSLFLVLYDCPSLEIKSHFFEEKINYHVICIPKNQTNRTMCSTRGEELQDQIRIVAYFRMDI